MYTLLYPTPFYIVRSEFDDLSRPTDPLPAGTQVAMLLHSEYHPDKALYSYTDRHGYVSYCWLHDVDVMESTSYRAKRPIVMQTGLDGDGRGTHGQTAVAPVGAVMEVIRYGALDSVLLTVDGRLYAWVDLSHVEPV